MKRVHLSFLCALLATGITAGSVRAEAVFKTSLVTSTGAAETGRILVELAADTDGTLLEDGEVTIESGEGKIDKDGTVRLRLKGVEDANGLVEGGTGLVLVNQGDMDGDGDQDFVFSGLFSIGGDGGEAGNVEIEFERAIPIGTNVEDVLFTVVFNSDDGEEPVLDNGDTILAVPGFTTEEEEVEEEEFEVEGIVFGLTGECPDVEFMVNETLVTADGDTEYENRVCEDLFGDDVQVRVKGVVRDNGTHLAGEIGFVEDTEPEPADGSDTIVLDEDGIIVIDGCNTEVPGDEDILENLLDCENNASNHGQFLSCVAKRTNDLRKDGLITGKEKGKIQKCAAQADIP